MLKYTSNLVFLLVLMQSITFAVSSLYLPSLPKISEYFAISKVQVQFTLSLYFLGLFVFTLFSNAIMSRWGEIRTLFIGCFLFIIASVFCVFSEDVLWLKIAFFLVAVGVGPMAILSRAFLGRISNGIRRSVMGTVYLSATLISSMAAPVIGGFISFFLWWQFVFVISSLFGLLILYRAKVFVQRNKGDDTNLEHKSMEYKAILTNKAFLLFFGIKWLLYALAQAYYVELPFILHQYGFNTKEIGIMILISGTGMIFGTFLSKLFIKCLEVRRVIATSLVVSLIGGALCAYQAINFDVYFFIFSAWVFMIGVGMSASNLMMMVLNSISKNLHTQMSAMYNMITLFMCFVVSSLVGHIANYGMEYFYILFLILPVLSILVFLRSKSYGLFEKV